VWDLGIDLETLKKAFDALKKIDKNVITCFDIIGYLERADIVKRH